MVTLTYLLPVLLNFIGMWCWIYLYKGSDKVPRWGAMLWFVVALVPMLNIIIGCISFISIFSIDTVYNWLIAPVKRD